MEAWAGEGAGPGGRALRGGGDCTGEERKRRRHHQGRCGDGGREGPVPAARGRPREARLRRRHRRRRHRRRNGAHRKGPGPKGAVQESGVVGRGATRLLGPGAGWAPAGTGPAPRAVASRPEALAPASRSSRGPHSFIMPTAGAAACPSWPVRFPRHRPRLLPSRLSDNNSTYSVPSGGPSSSPVANSCGLQQVDDVGDNFFPVLQ
ncbi:serine/arginine repetitive matrix protein 3-like [Canis lupus dingo]|uniref:serine/arginine repetitive matrix protein 3-like n=1 Tax=Canis lupus dingo TaxID=286419 RepID=UPI000DC667FC|nr:serine/arginine repetitive matrix protein 3-like [Canis lupus dingo]